MSRKKYDNYIETVVSNHIHQAEVIIGKLMKYKLNPKIRKEYTLGVLLNSGLMPNIAFIIEAERMGEIVFGIKSKLQLPELVREVVEDAKRLPLVVKGDETLETSTGIDVDMMYEALKNANENIASE